MKCLITYKHLYIHVYTHTYCNSNDQVETLKAASLLKDQGDNYIFGISIPI